MYREEASRTDLLGLRRGLGEGEMVLEFAPDCTKNKEMKQYLLDRGLEIEEVSEHVD